MIRKLVFQLLYHLHIISTLHWINKRRGRFPILVFHRVSPHADPLWSPLSVEAFEEILVLLKKQYTILPLENIFEYSDKQLAEACFISFDDGFEDNYVWARPILLKHAVPASFFIPSNCVALGEVIWPLQLRNSFSNTVVKNLDLVINNASVSFSLTNQQEKIRAYEVMMKYLSTLKEKDFLSTLSFIFEHLGEFDDDHIRIMNHNQLTELAADFGIHSHTQNHYYLSALGGERVVEEFIDSIEDLNTWLLPHKVKFLAYPVGDYSKEIAREASNYFAASFRVGDELAQTRSMTDKDYRMKIPRFNIHHNSPYEVYALINGFHGFLRRLLNPFMAKG